MCSYCDENEKRRHKPTEDGCPSLVWKKKFASSTHQKLKPSSEKTTNQWKTGPKTEAAASPKNKWYRRLKTWTRWQHRVLVWVHSNQNPDRRCWGCRAARPPLPILKVKQTLAIDPAAATTLGWLLPCRQSCPVQWSALGCCPPPRCRDHPIPVTTTHVVSRAGYRNKNAFSRGPVHGCSFPNTQTCWCREG